MRREGLRLVLVKLAPFENLFGKPLLNRPENGVLKGLILLSFKYLAKFLGYALDMSGFFFQKSGF